MNKIELYFRKYFTKKNIQEYFFIILMAFVVIFFVFYSFEDPGCSRCHITWEWDIFKRCLFPCFCLIFLHYLSKITRVLTILTRHEDIKNK